MTGKQWGTLGVLALIWGSSFLFIKWGLEEVSFLSVVAGRLIFGLVFLFGASLVQGLGLPRRALWRRLAVVALANNVIPWILLVWGEQFIPSGIAAMLNATTPLFTLLLASTWGDEQLSWLKVTGLIVGFLGVAVVIGQDLVTAFTQAGGTMTVLGELAVLVMAISYAFGAVYGRRNLRGESALQLATGQLLIAFIVVLPITLFTNSLPTTLPSLQAIGGIAALGFFGSGMAYFLFYGLLESVGATRTVIVTYLLPIVAIVLGWAVLNEMITLEMVAGMALILTGVLLVNNGAVTFRTPLETAKTP